MGDMADWVNDQDDFGADGLDDDELDTNAIARIPVWTTKEGERIPINQMDTVHLFNTMKLCFNHLAEAYGGVPVWFTHRYEGFGLAARLQGKKLVWWTAILLGELARRDDLPARYLQPLAEIREQVYGGPERVKGSGTKMLGPPR